jgi:calcineurin-like phosphoesterase family protein
MKYFSSDWHLGHNSVLSYCNRPYKDLEEMHIAIINTCNDTVKETDSLYLLGDTSLNPKWVELFIPQLICKDIHMILGNHDAPFPNKLGAKAQKTLNARKRYFKAGVKSMELSANMQLGKYYVELCHFPFAPKPRVLGEDMRYLDNRPVDNGQILLHGHLHGKYRKRANMIDVCFDGDLKIFSENDIIALIEDPRDFIPTPITEFYLNRKNKENEE